MPDTLIEHGVVITLNRQRDIFAPGYVWIAGDRIAAVGAGSAPAELAGRADRRIDAAQTVVMPGMVNAHDHLFQTFVRGLSDNRSLLDWLREIVWPVGTAMTAHDVYLAAKLALVENLHGGATAVIDNQYLHSDPGNDDAVCQAAAELGIRFRLARGWTDRNGLPAMLDNADHIIAETERAYQSWHNRCNGRISVEFGPGAPWGCSEETMQRTYALIKERGIGLHMHVAETREEIAMCRQETGLGHIEWLGSMGMLAPTTQLVHSVWLTDHEIDMIAESGAVVVHCPVSNSYLASGISQVGRLRQRGIPVALATDGACNNGLGVIDVLKWAANLQKVATADAAVLSSADLLEMACQGGAAALGQAGTLGSLEPGKKADVILVDRQTTRLALARDHELPAALVYTACSADVNTVLVDGEIVLQDHAVKGVDEAALVAEAREAWDAVLRRAGLAAD